MICSARTELSPSIVFTATGKKQISSDIITFEPMPKPNHTMMIGASATFGTVWNATM